MFAFEFSCGVLVGVLVRRIEGKVAFSSWLGVWFFLVGSDLCGGFSIGVGGLWSVHVRSGVFSSGIFLWFAVCGGEGKISGVEFELEGVSVAAKELKLPGAGVSSSPSWWTIFSTPLGELLSFFGSMCVVVVKVDPGKRRLFWALNRVMRIQGPKLGLECTTFLVS